MLEEKYLRLDDLAAPDGYVALSTSEDLAYIAHFRQACKRYNIDFASADQDERDFVIHMAEKNFCSKRALTHTVTHTRNGAHGTSGDKRPKEYLLSEPKASNGRKMALWHLSG